MEILTYGNATLRKKAVAVDISSQKERDNLKGIFEKMTQTMYKKRGLGLAAPQVNISKRFFILDVDQDDKTDDDGNVLEHIPGKLQVFINPVILETEGDVFSEEGCLSVPGLYEKIKRFEKVKVEYYDETFNKNELVAEGLLAIVIQHEYDHLEGKLFIDRLPLVRKTLIKNKLNKGKIL